MAFWRTRIKGVANIPARKKKENETPPIKDLEVDKNDDDTTSNTQGVEESVTEKISEESVTNDVQKNEESKSVVQEKPPDDVSQSSITNPPIRRILKPKVSVLNATRRNTSETDLKALKTPVPDEPVPAESLPESKNQTQDPAEKNLALFTTLSLSPVIKNDTSLKESCPNKQAPASLTDGAISGSDSEQYSSISRLNRSRIRPVPRLGVRRNSIQGSASESEDEARKNVHFSVPELPPPIITEKSLEPPLKKALTVVQRKARRSDSTRKILDAKKEFFKKFGNEAPDRSKLTMMDFIFYNPVGTPMSAAPKQVEIREINDGNEADEENVDDPDAVDEDNEDDEVAVPQVKMGPDGNIIIDEQSLIVERTGLKKARKQLEKSQAIALDGAQATYKKIRKRSKRWTDEETIKFYRVLNTVGTDFSIMLTMFPGRTRKELLLKFRHEERVNGRLVDKAILNPRNFDLKDLEDRLKQDEMLKMPPMPKDISRKKRRTKAVGACQIEIDVENDEENSCMQKKRRTSENIEPSQPRNNNYKAVQDGIECVVKDTEQDTDIQFINILKPTRFGRKPRPKIFELPEEEKRSRKEQETVSNKEKDLSQINESKQQKQPRGRPKNYIRNIQRDEVIEVVESSEEDESGDDEVSTILKATRSGRIPKMKTHDLPKAAAMARKTVPSSPLMPRLLPNSIDHVDPGSMVVLMVPGPNGENTYQMFMVAPKNAAPTVPANPQTAATLNENLGQAAALTFTPDKQNATSLDVKQEQSSIMTIFQSHDDHSVPNTDKDYVAAVDDPKAITFIDPDASSNELEGDRTISAESVTFYSPKGNILQNAADNALSEALIENGNYFVVEVAENECHDPLRSNSTNAYTESNHSSPSSELLSDSLEENVENNITIAHE